jgi:hypothetical protein
MLATAMLALRPVRRAIRAQWIPSGQTSRPRTILVRVLTMPGDNAPRLS